MFHDLVVAIRTSRSAFSFLVLGLLCSVATIGSAWYLNEALTRLLPALLAEGALIFLSALVIERTLLREFDSSAHERTERLTEDVTASITTFFKDRFDDFQLSDEYQVHFAPPRRSGSRHPLETYDKIAEAISRAKTLRICCTSGIDIFPPPNTIPTPIVTMIRNRVQRPETFSITVLSCDPTGEYARIRGRLENKVNPNYLQRDIEDSQLCLNQIAYSAKPEFTWLWLTHRAMPQAWFALTETDGFIEIYHFGLGRRDPGDGNSCIGGRIPILHVSAGSSLWQAMNEYFDFLVTPNTDTEIERIRTEYFGVTVVQQGRGADGQTTTAS
ncbi:MAG: hypothetical protein HYZ50_09170 [Deltaproteobacteria bacterium]|nr:hypothetical protein [Deltaproteobacteria bacterium]